MSRSSSDGGIRSERIPLHIGPRLVLVVCFLIALWVLISEVANGRGHVLVWLVLAPATVLLGLVVFAYQRIEVTSSDVVFTWFPLYRRRVPFDQIANVEVVEVVPWKFGGWGLRLHAHGVALTNRGGSGVSVTSSSGNTTIISVENPDRYLMALSARGVPTR